MRFEDITWLYLALAAPFALAPVAWHGIRSSSRAIENLLSPESAARLIPDGLTAARSVRAACLGAAIVLILVAMARPQYGVKPIAVKRAGMDIMLLVDTSNSMVATDIKPSRMTRAKDELSRIVSALEGNRIGLVAFAGESFIECPLTLDSTTVRLFLDTLDVGIIPTPGTAIGNAVRNAVEALNRSQAAKSKSIILVTDGEDLAGDVEPAAEIAQRSGVKIYGIGLGSVSGAPVPELNEIGEITGYKKDESGAPKLTRLDTTSLELLSSATGGISISSQGERLDISGIVEHIKKQEKTDIGSFEFSEYEERYQTLVAFALMILLGEYIFTAWRPGRSGAEA